MSLPAVPKPGGIVVRRRVDFHPPVQAPADAALVAIADHLRRRRCWITQRGPLELVIKPPSFFDTAFSFGAVRHTVAVEACVLRLDAVSPISTVRLEVRYTTGFWISPLLVATLMVLILPFAAMRVFTLLFITLAVWHHASQARMWFEDEVVRGARRAEGP